MYYCVFVLAKTERKTGTFTAFEQCLLQVTSIINTQHNSNLELCSLHKNWATQKQVMNLELTKSLFMTGDEMLTSYSRCHAKNVQIAGRSATGLPLKWSSEVGDRTEARWVHRNQKPYSTPCSSLGPEAECCQLLRNKQLVYKIREASWSCNPSEDEDSTKASQRPGRKNRQLSEVFDKCEKTGWLWTGTDRKHGWNPSVVWYACCENRGVPWC